MVNAKPARPEYILQLIIDYIDTVSDWSGRIISWLLAVMTIITCTIVILRYGLKTGSLALQESVTYLHASVFLLAMGYALKNDAHVRVDIFYRQFDKYQKAWVNSLGHIIFLMPLCVFIIGSSWEYVLKSWQIKESSSDPGGLPAVFLLKSLLPLSALILALQGTADILRSVLTFIVINSKK